MIREAINCYYKKLDEKWLTLKNTHPMVPFIEEMPQYMYIGKKNSSDYIEWTLAVNKNKVDFNKIAETTGVVLREDLRAYFESYYFLKLTGEFKNIKITITPITPLVDINVFLLKRLKIAKDQDRDINKIELGLAEIDGADCYLLFVDNNTGNVEVLDVEKGMYKTISNSLSELISNLKPGW